MKLEKLQGFANDQLQKQIMPFWRNHMTDMEQGGFYAQVENNLSVDRTAKKGLVLNARLLWTFSAVFNKFKKEEDRQLAHRAYEYIISNFFDPDQGGYYWSLNPDGSCCENKKQIYAQAFTIYGFSEYYRMTKDSGVLQKAIDLFNLIEKEAFDSANNGYIEALDYKWEAMDDIRLSAKDMNEKKSMNTHLHLLEAYANLYSVWKSSLVKEKLENLIGIFTDIIINTHEYNQYLFFDDKWNVRSNSISFGHDIETSWLLHEAALVSENEKLINRVIPISINMCDKTALAISNLGALYYEYNKTTSHWEKEIEWWVQAEAIVGHLNAYVLTKEDKYLDRSLGFINFIENYMVDKKLGEWFFRVSDKGIQIKGHEKAGFWKCPYHNARACMEILSRINILNG